MFGLNRLGILSRTQLAAWRRPFYFLSFVVGAFIGLVAGLLMRGDDEQGVFVNVLVGVLGALIAGWVIAPYFGLHAGDPKVLDFGALSVALVGAIVSLALLSLLRRRRG